MNECLEGWRMEVNECVQRSRVVVVVADSSLWPDYCMLRRCLSPADPEARDNTRIGLRTGC